MKKTLTALLAAAAIAGSLTVSGTEASAQGRGFGPGLALGIFGGLVASSIILHSMRPGYAAYPGYAEPVYGPGCYWTRQAIYDRRGRIVGWTGEVVQVCP